MSSIVIAGDTSGTITLSAPAVAGSNTISLPAVTGTILTTAYTGAVTFDGDFTVDTDTLHVDSTNNRVGIGKTNPTTALDVVGTVTATAFAGALTGNVTGDVSGNAGTVTNGVYTTDIGSTVEAYSATNADYADTTANFTGTLQNSGSNVVVDSDIGSTVQAYDADLTTLGGLSSADGNFIVGSATGWVVESGATARTSLGLGTAATTASTDYATAAQGSTADSALQPGDIGSTVQAYDADTTKNDVANTFTANQTINGDLTVDTNTLYVDSTNNYVGIGTTSPVSKLTVAGSSAVLSLVDTDRAVNTYGAVWADQDGNVFLNADYDGTAGGGFISFRSNGSSVGSEKMRIDSSGNVGIGTTSPSAKLNVDGAASDALALFTNNGTASAGGNGFRVGIDNSLNAYVNNTKAGPLVFSTSNAERMRITSTGLVGIGTTNPSFKLQLSGSGTQTFRITSTDGANADLSCDGTSSMSLGTPNGMPIRFVTNNSEQMRIDSSGNVGIGTTSTGSYKLHINGSRAYLVSSANTELMTTCTGGGAQVTGGVQALTNQSIRLGSINDFNTEIVRANVVKATATTSGFAISGALSKSSGSFKIDHPIPELTDTHHLVHSFVESPQANNIYRGKVELVNGQAIVNLDTVSSMTEGTFVLLNRDIHCYTSNETDWDAVKGSVNENILTIECQNTNSAATVSWLVIGERHDIHMYDTDWTDENGKVIVEPLKTQAELNAQAEPAE